MTAPEPAPSIRISTASDEALAVRARNGSLTCFAELVARYESRIYNFLRRRTAIVSDAEDLAQDTFLRAWERIGQFQPGRRFSTWIFTIAARLAINHHRRTRRARARLETAATSGPAPPEDPAETVASRDLREHAWSLAARVLTDDQNAVLWLRYAESMSIAEIARIMGRTSLSVRVQLFRARQALATQLADTAPAPSAATPEPAFPTLRQPVAGGIR